MDTPTKNRIAKLHPSVRNEVTIIIQECDKALTGRATVRVTQGLRTFAEQDALYQQGRTTAGKKVTNAKLSEEFPSWSPYSMCFNNPVKFVDPDGMAPLLPRFL